MRFKLTYQLTQSLAHADKRRIGLRLKQQSDQ
jgi:hypothetical protein